jgi:hypothetical protein
MSNFTSDYESEEIGKQKFIASYFLNLLVKHFGGDVRVMGGSPRDWDLGHKAKDIDIFIHSPLLSEKKIESNISKLGIDFNKIEKNKNYAGNPNLISVWEANYWGETIQLIFTNINTLDVLKSFPVNLSMIWWDAIHGFHYNNSYLIGKNTLSLIKMNSDTYTSDYYINKIKDKFQNFTYYESLQDFMVNFVPSKDEIFFD